MKYYSEITKKTYDTEEECLDAEAAIAKKNDARKEAAAKVEEKAKALAQAKKEYYDELNAFCKVYGAYHKTYTSKDANDNLDLVNIFQDIFSW